MEKETCGGPLGKLTCMWEDAVYLGINSTTGEGHHGEQEWRVAHKNGQEDGVRKMGPKQSGDDRGSSVAQERRRCQDVGRASKKEKS